jgi:hypothetical protein
MTHKEFDKLINDLQGLETSLYSNDVDKKYKIDPKFLRFRIDLAVIIGKLRNAQLADIDQQLTELSPELEAGITNLNEKLKILAEIKVVLDLIAKVIGLAARIAMLVK